jgi:hypothetical protein
LDGAGHGRAIPCRTGQALIWPNEAGSAFMSLPIDTQAPWRGAWLVLMLALATPVAAEVAGQRAVPRNVTEEVMKAQPKETGGGTLRTTDRIRDVLDHPQLATFAHLMLPWDEGSYDPDTRLDEISSMLPYHTHVAPEVVVGALNRIIGDAGNGNTVFFDFYTDEQKQADRERHSRSSLREEGSRMSPRCMRGFLMLWRSATGDSMPWC